MARQLSSSAGWPQKNRRTDALQEWSSKNARSPTSPSRPTPVRLPPAAVPVPTGNRHTENSVSAGKAFSTTSSFSSGSSEQVEYTSLPPAATRCIAARRIASCRPCKSTRSPGCNRHLISGLCARVPVPEQGTSARTRSKPALAVKSSTSELITSTVPGWNQFPQQPGTVSMQLQSNNAGLGISLRQYARLAPGRGATIQDSRPLSHQQRHQLRGLVLDRNSALSEGPSAGNTSGSHPARRSQ